MPTPHQRMMVPGDAHHQQQLRPAPASSPVATMQNAFHANAAGAAAGHAVHQTP
eukprot:CAMPEP_0197259436 /NCGR_PEP_ID=MMETSP1429-20130617/83519_1 /TAXON_ID=49237 /ORGANISM="Chaetoceros  sp., Strain UNC1202" /LENGTH=53 /DNA_ID=CAMNT_0042723645 /DNA_START=682 /DNA_END=839 /DNA_ORIENTATION=+